MANEKQRTVVVAYFACLTLGVHGRQPWESQDTNIKFPMSSPGSGGRNGADPRRALLGAKSAFFDEEIAARWKGGVLRFNQDAVHWCRALQRACSLRELPSSYGCRHGPEDCAPAGALAGPKWGTGIPTPSGRRDSLSAHEAAVARIAFVGPEVGDHKDAV